MLSLFRKNLKPIKDEFSTESFSQCGEDRIIHVLFQFLKIQKPFYIDIGAHHPSHFSNTKLFYDAGACGINIEPDPSLIELFKNQRPRDINLNIGIDDEEGISDFYEMTAKTLNTFSKEEAEKVSAFGTYFINAVHKIPVKTIHWVLSNYAGEKEIDFLSVDVEGIDERLINSINFNEVRPKVICVETINYTEDNTEKKNFNIINKIQSENYLHYADTYINSIFVDRTLWEKR